MDTRSLPTVLVARIGAVLIGASAIVSGVAHLVNPVGMEASARIIITTAALVVAAVVWVTPWDRLPEHSLWSIAHAMLTLKVFANVVGGYGPYSYGIHFTMIAVWMGLALPRWSVLASAPIFAGAYIVPMLITSGESSIASSIVVIPICVTIGECIGWIVERLRRVDVAEASYREDLAWLLDAATKLAEEQEPEDLARLIADLSLRMPGANGAVVLVKGQSREFDEVASITWAGDAFGSVKLGDEPAFIEAAKRRRMLVWSDHLCRDLASRVKVPNLCVIPLFGSRGCLGIVLVAGEDSSPEADEISQQLGETLAIQAGLALERQGIREELYEASLRDELTQLGNRRKAHKRLSRLSRGDALVLIDLDHFKQANDSAGHLRGDEILREVANHLRDTLRHDDEIFRVGGDEFLVILDRPGEGCTVATERVLEGWRMRSPELSLSIGVAIHLDGEDAEGTIARADRALYAAKEAGRDQVRMAD